ncbi:MAG: hypothetical protein MUC87_17625 [Bacteroidia bacterium]|jgi:hypothetical protein|nr:hypothetical protein [Bacteroidia bacterium]
MGRFRKLLSRVPWLARFYYFFPIQLLLVQLKKNPVPILFWLIMFGFVTGKFAAGFGVPLLFVDPEYRGEVDFVSYAIIGFACGGFIMAYQISCYIHNSYRFPFLATTAHPFLKFCINNFMIPLLFQIVYISRIFHFLSGEPITTAQVWINVAGYIFGNALFTAGAGYYFFLTHRHLDELYDKATLGKSTPRVKRIFLSRDPISKALKWKKITPGRERRDWHVETYMALPWRIRRARPFEHYDKELLNRVFRHNHSRAVFFEMIVLLTLLTMGLFRDVQWMMIPSGACIFLLFTLYLMFTGVLYTWCRGWSNTVMVGILLLFNWLHQFDLFDNRTRAFGMDYTVEAAPYSMNRLMEMDSDAAARHSDSLAMINVLENWKARQPGDSLHKPKLVIFNCSGGGLRSAMWTLRTMQHLDSVSGGRLMQSTALICGSSGGMLGAAYMREIWLRQQTGENFSCRDPKYLNDIGSDILNPMSVSIAVNDWFLPLRRVKVNNHSYSRNRSFEFEQQLLRNTDSLFDKSLAEYREPEQKALIPMMVFAPTIAADGRKLVISSQRVSWLTQEQPGSNVSYQRLPDGVEFSRLFEKQGADEVRFSSVLRMNATFPYITPLTELPSNPAIEVFDAGMRDNFGVDNAVLFLHTFRKWIEANTSGVIMLQTRDRSKLKEVTEKSSNTISASLSRPLSSFYGNLFSVQNYNQDRMLDYASSWLACPLDVIDFELEHTSREPVALSWHLTQREKLQVISSTALEQNISATQRFAGLMAGGSTREMKTAPRN